MKLTTPKNKKSEMYMLEQWIILIIEKIGYIGVFLMIALENIFPPIPSEVILTFSGFMTTKSNMHIVGVIVAATLGSVVGALVLYKIGELLGINRLQKIVKKYGKFFRLKPSDITQSMQFYDRFKMPTVFFCRMIPLLRSLISIPAGMAKMRLDSFLILTAAGSLIWNCVLILLGAVVGSAWQSIVAFIDMYSWATYGLIGVLSVILIAAYIFSRLPKTRRIRSHLLKYANDKEKCAASIIDLSDELFLAFLEYKYARTINPSKMMKKMRQLMKNNNADLIADEFNLFCKNYFSLFNSNLSKTRMLKYLPHNDYVSILVGANINKYENIDELINTLQIYFYRIWAAGIDTSTQKNISNKLMEKIFANESLAAVKAFLESELSDKSTELDERILKLGDYDFCSACLLYLYYKQNRHAEFVADDSNLRLITKKSKEGEVLGLVDSKSKKWLIRLDWTKCEKQRQLLKKELFAF